MAMYSVNVRGATFLIPALTPDSAARQAVKWYQPNPENKRVEYTTDEANCDIYVTRHLGGGGEIIYLYRIVNNDQSSYDKESALDILLRQHEEMVKKLAEKDRVIEKLATELERLTQKEEGEK
jgi:hypothetical protein